MNRIITILFIFTLIFCCLLVVLYPDSLSHEGNVKSFEQSISTTTNRTTYKPTNVDYTQRIKKLVGQKDLSFFTEIIDQSNESMLKDFDQQLETIRQANIKTFAYAKFNKFKEDNGQLEGIYWNGYLFNNNSKRNSIIEILSTTSVNTLVIDVKTDNGHILFDADIEEISLLKNKRIKFSSEDLIELRKIKDLYLIGRIVVYQDPLFAQTFPDEAVFDSNLNKPYSQNGQYFLDPSSKKVQTYIKNIASQACELGFDEI